MLIKIKQQLFNNLWEYDLGNCDIGADVASVKERHNLHYNKMCFFKQVVVSKYSRIQFLN